MVCEQQIDILVIIHWKSLWSIGWVLFNWLVKMVHKSVINNCFVSMNQNDFIQYNSNWKVMKMYWSKSVGTLCDTYTVLHKSYGPRFVCLYFGAWIATVLIHILLIYWYFIDIYFILIFIKKSIFVFCSRKSGRFGTTWGWVNDKICIFGWTIPLGIATYRVKRLMLYCFTNKVGIWIITLYNFTKF